MNQLDFDFTPKGLKEGDLVRHKLSGDLMTIRRTDGVVATCELQIPWFSKFEPDTPRYTAICSVENLEKEP